MRNVDFWVGFIETSENEIETGIETEIETQFYSKTEFESNLIKHTIRKVKILSKNSILTKPQYFHEFFTQIYFDNFFFYIKVVNS